MALSITDVSGRRAGNGQNPFQTQDPHRSRAGDGRRGLPGVDTRFRRGASAEAHRRRPLAPRGGRRPVGRRACAGASEKRQAGEEREKGEGRRRRRRRKTRSGKRTRRRTRRTRRKARRTERGNRSCENRRRTRRETGAAYGQQATRGGLPDRGDGEADVAQTGPPGGRVPGVRPLAGPGLRGQDPDHDEDGEPQQQSDQRFVPLHGNG